MNEQKNEKDLKKRDKTADRLYDVFDKLKNARKKALETKERELSPWNLVWKILRAEGYLDKIIKCVNANYDIQNSIKESKTVILSDAQKQKFF